MSKQSMIKQLSSLMVSGLLVFVVVCFSLLVVSAGVVSLGYLLSYFSTTLFHGETMGIFHYVLVVLAIGCTAGLGIPILLLARNIQRSTENFSLLQFDGDNEEDDEYDMDDINSIAHIINNKYQTLTYFGVDKSELLDFVVKNRLSGIDRIVPVGQALDIGIIWDGYDIVRSLSRIIDVK